VRHQSCYNYLYDVWSRRCQIGHHTCWLLRITCMLRHIGRHPLTDHRIHRELIRASIIDLGRSSLFEYLSVKLSHPLHRASPVNVAILCGSKVYFHYSSHHILITNFRLGRTVTGVVPLICHTLKMWVNQFSLCRYLYVDICTRNWNKRWCPTNDRTFLFRSEKG